MVKDWVLGIGAALALYVMLLGVLVQARPYLASGWPHVLLILTVPVIAWRVARASQRRRERRNLD